MFFASLKNTKNVVTRALFLALPLGLAAQVANAGISVSNSTPLESAGSINVTVTYPSGSSGRRVDTYGGTATEGTDYQGVHVSVGVLSTTQTIAIYNDSNAESDETFSVCATWWKRIGTEPIDFEQCVDVTILDGTPRAAFSVSDVSVNENGGNATFTITRSGPLSATNNVNFATANGSASAGSDYVSTTGGVSFAPNETSKTVSVLLIDDSAYEGNESFYLNLNTPTGGAVIADGQGVATIVDNERATVSFAIADAVVDESEGSVTLTVTKTNEDGVAHSLNWATATGTAGTGDFIAASGVLNFGNGVTSQPITISIRDNLIREGTENFYVNLSGLTGGGVISDSQAVVTIYDDDFDQCNPICP